MRNVIVLALVLASAPASAQPVNQPCAVTIARAPDDVRIVVDAWVAAEPSCSTPLEVRIVPTEGGLYLLARDDQGRVRERIVPDAQSAGVLIASWAADDVMAAPVTPPPAPEPVAPAPTPPVAPTPAPEPAVAPPPDLGPSMAPGAIGGIRMTPQVDAPPAASKPRPISKWISVGGLVGDGEDSGLRGEIDILTRGKWSFGLAAAAASAHDWSWGPEAGGELRAADQMVTATVTRNLQYWRFQLRASAGVGIVHSEVLSMIEPYDPTRSNPYAYAKASGLFPVIDASLLAGFELGKNWAVTGGPVFTLIDETFQLESTEMSWEPPPPMTLPRQNLQVMAYAGLRYRL